MPTKKKTEPKKTPVQDPQEPVDGMGTQDQDRPGTVEERYERAVERCGLNIPLILHEILHEVMLWRAGK